MAAARTERLLTSAFVLTCLTTATVYTSFFFLVPTLPVYVINVDGTESDVGVVMGILTLFALVRPWVGREADRRGHRWLLLGGLAWFAICTVGYVVARTIPSLILIQILRGIAWAFITTLLSTLISDLAPAARRGEAIGYYGVAVNLAMALGPAIGVYLMDGFGFEAMFLIGAGIAGLSLLLGALVREDRSPRPREDGGGSFHLVSRGALMPSLLMGTVNLGYGTMLTFLPLYAKNNGVENPGIFFTVFAVVILVARPLAGKASDVYGRDLVIVPGVVIAAMGVAMGGLSGSLPTLVLAAVLFGLGIGTVQPALMALAVDRVDPRARGAAMGTFTGAYDLGIGIGAMLMGFVIGLVGYSTMFVVAGAVPLLGLVGFFAFSRREARQSLLGGG